MHFYPLKKIKIHPKNDVYRFFHLFLIWKTVLKLNFLIKVSTFDIKSPKFGGIEASLLFKFGEIGALQNSGNLLKIRRDWSLPFREIGVPPRNPTRL